MGKEDEQGRLPIDPLEGDDPDREPLDPVTEAQGILEGRIFQRRIDGVVVLPKRVSVFVSRDVGSDRLHFDVWDPARHPPEKDLPHIPLHGGEEKKLSFEDQIPRSLSTVLKQPGGTAKTDWTGWLKEQDDRDGVDSGYRIPKQTATHIGPPDPEHPPIKKRPESFFTNLGQIFYHKRKK